MQQTRRFHGPNCSCLGRSPHGLSMVAWFVKVHMQDPFWEYAMHGPPDSPLHGPTVPSIVP